MSPAQDLAGAVPRTPARPGPGPMPEALLRTLDLRSRRRVNGFLPGDHRSSALGAGSELSRIRPYRTGDDVRLMDWNVTARTGEPHVREHEAEKGLTALVALDASPSMNFGTATRRKADVAEGVVLALAHLATRGGNRLGLLTFGGGEAEALPPRGGRVARLGILTALCREPAPEGIGTTSLGVGLRRTSRLARGRGLVAVVSDLRGPRDWRRPLLELAGRHEVIVFEVRDPREQRLPDVGDLWFEDPETGRQLRANTADGRLRERFAAAAAAEREEVAREIRSAGADHLVLSSDGDWLRTLAGSLGRRRGGRR